MFRRFILMALLFFPIASAAAESSTGTIQGRVEVPEMESYRGVVSVWDGSEGRMPDPRRYIMIPFAAAPLLPSGDFQIEVPPGKYYLGAVVRQSQGPPMGPPREGDLVFMTPDRMDQGLLVDVVAGEKVDVGVRNLSWAYLGMTVDGGLVVRGRVLDRQGKPVSGLLVFGFGDPEMSQRPLAVSQRTDGDGRYALSLDRPGQVYLRVRENYGGGTPAEGGYMGVYGGQVAVPVAVSGDQAVEGTDITVFKIPKRKSGGMKMRQTVQ